MIIACPACRTRYVVPDSAIGVDGRTVRCAKCKHSWFQDAQGLPDDAPRAPAAPPPVAQPTAAPQTPASTPPAAPAATPAAPPPLREPAPQRGMAAGDATARPTPHVPRRPQEPVPAHPAAQQPAPQESAPRPVPQPGFSALSAQPDEPVVRPRRTPIIPSPPAAAAAPQEAGAEPPFAAIPDDVPAPPAADDYDDGYGSSFDHAPPFGPRRNMARIWTILAVLFALAALGAGVAVSMVGVPSWVPFAQPLFGAGPSDLKLDFPVAEQERRTLPNGTEYFGARITVTNSARESRAVPDILIVMRDERERQVYSWVVKPPQPRLAPGESMTITEAATDVPKAAVFADIGWAPN